MRTAEFQPRTVLVHVGLDLIGDGLLKMPFLRALRDLWPQARVTWAASQGRSVFAGVLAPAVAGLIDEVIEQADVPTRWGDLLRSRPLDGRGFDLIIDTQRGPAATLALKRLPHRRLVSPAVRGALSSWGCRPAKGKRPAAMLRQMLDLLEQAAGVPVPTPDQSLIPVPEELRAATAAVVPQGVPLVGLAPGAGGRHKCWPQDSFVALARRQAEAGRVPVILLGPAELEWQTALQEQVPQALFPLQDPRLIDGRGLTPFVTIALAGHLHAVVCNDAGVGHLAAASGTPVVVLYGPTSPKKFAPLTRRGCVITAQECGGSAMADIPVAVVADRINALLA
ncbi:glycosyltransferase family 9 protein [Novispirillum itersonii]|uniref:ADP-heptose:LPS heptosyltransferase n=1 Tax=Novispirillum itersonii TaxID=189 RepID=A0A7W9ZDW0_NOVIT|nr:glycosyltransferase family 9 protein [Novispirillum itersonii]MBB6208827.1 ADP-heptose:LPS heptosyltransferase [Novispirillum itersonii]